MLILNANPKTWLHNPTGMECAKTFFLFKHDCDFVSNNFNCKT